MATTGAAAREVQTPAEKGNLLFSTGRYSHYSVYIIAGSSFSVALFGEVAAICLPFALAN
jgi:hypothetical protein